MSDMQTKLDYVDAIADWFLDIGEAHSLHGNLEEGLKCNYIAASILNAQNRNLVSSRIESNLRFVAGCVTTRNNLRDVTPRKTGNKEVSLHVMSNALLAGGHTAMAMRWMINDRSERIHSIALLEQTSPIPDRLRQAVRDTGGSIYTANASDSFLNKAAWLKNLANDLASHVILHIDVSDVICGVAFGTKGGPPVLLVNHAAHIFWTGACVADLVLNCRGSALEGLWTSTYRGISRYATVPIPLLEPSARNSECTSSFELKHQAKKILDIPTDSILILTIGAFFKYLPIHDLDFIEVCESILKELPKAFLVVVGFDEDNRWRRASLRLRSRIRVLGTVSQSKLAKIHEAADVYIEGFPFGSTTALLEAGLKGIPVVLAPAQCPPPYGSDGVALDYTLERPSTLEEYKTRIVQLCNNPIERKHHGDKIRDAVTKHHTGWGWRQYLEDALRKLPHEHSTYPSATPVQTPKAIHEYWSAFVTKWSNGYEEALEHAVVRALSIGLRPQLTNAALRTFRDYRSVRIHRTIPLPLLAFLCNSLLPFLPIRRALKIFGLVSFFCRRNLLCRVHGRVVRSFGRINSRRPWYEEYRHVRE